MNRKRYQHGSVIVLFAALLIPVLALLALVVDLGMVANAQRAMQDTAGRAAFGALAQYQEQLPLPAGAAGAVGAALTRAEQIAHINNNVGRINREDPDQQERFDQSANSELYDGRVMFGKWHYVDDWTEDGGVSPCEGAATAPCFEEIDPLIEVANAVKVRIRNRNSNPIRTIFAKVIGQEFVQVSGDQVAALTPQNNVFMVDLSRSIIRTNHIQWRVGGQPSLAAEFAFELAEDSPGSDGDRAQTDRPGPYIFPAGDTDSNAWLDLRASPDDHGIVIDPDGGWTLDPNALHWHTKSDYIVRQVTFDGQPKRFLVDGRFGASADPLQGPQPLLGVLQAVNTAANIIKNRAVSADGFAAYGIDDSEPFEERSLPLTRPRCSDPDCSGASPFEEFLRMTDVGEGNTDFIAHAFFPRRANTDLYLALQVALQQVAGSAVRDFARNNVILFTDGQTNCLENPPGGGFPRCNNDGWYMYNSLNRLRTGSLVEDYITRKVAISVVLIGPASGGHNILRKSMVSGLRCMDEVEVATFNDSNAWVDSKWGYYSYGTAEQLLNDFAESSASRPFYLPNELYNILVRPTRGRWITIRDCLRDNAGSCINFQTSLNTYCQSAAVAPGHIFQNLTAGQLGILGVPANTLVTDEAGRMMVDPLARTEQQQLSDAIELLMENPFRLVRSD